MKFKILSYSSSITTTEKYGFLGLKTKYNTITTIIEESDPKFSVIDSYFKSSYNYLSYRIHSVLRLCDYKILTLEDDILDFECNYDPGYIEKIGGFCLDDDDYYGYILKSKSGIQVAIGGGTFLDICDVNKTPLKELRKLKLERLKRTCNGGVS